MTNYVRKPKIKTPSGIAIDVLHAWGNLATPEVEPS